MSTEEIITYKSENQSGPPDLRILHYNDVYHIEPGSAEPAGGIARFQTVCNYYRNDDRFKGQPGLVTLFSGDAFNPSLESSVTKGPFSRPSLLLRSACTNASHKDGSAQADVSQQGYDFDIYKAVIWFLSSTA